MQTCDSLPMVIRLHVQYIPEYITEFRKLYFVVQFLYCVQCSGNVVLTLSSENLLIVLLLQSVS